MSRCRSCNGEILWGVTAKSRRMPLDAEPSPEGTFVLRDGKLESAIGAEPEEPKYVSHFATCPNATAHRRPG